MGKFTALAAEACATILVVFALTELALRIFPGIIPPSLLVNFQSDLRQDIARRLGLPTVSDTYPLERDDGGPALRVYQPSARISIPVAGADAALGAEESVEMDEQGFCNPERVAGHKAAIVTLGDSFAWCLSVQPEETWPAQLARSSGYAAYNLGMPGTEPYAYVQLLKRFGISRSPAAVVMSVFEGNDFQGAWEFSQYRAGLVAAGGRAYLAVPCIGLPSPLCYIYRSLKEGFVGRRSYAFNVAANAARDSIVGLREAARPTTKGNRRYRLVLPSGEVTMNPTNTSDWDGADRIRSGSADFRVFDGALVAFKNLSVEHRFRPVVVYMPAPYTVYRRYAVFEDPAVGALAFWFSDAQREYLAGKAEELGLAFLDLTPTMQQAAAAHGEMLYFPMNLHLTAVGHRVVAEALAGALSRNGILP